MNVKSDFKISDIIRMLEDIKAVHGDLPVFRTGVSGQPFELNGRSINRAWIRARHGREHFDKFCDESEAELKVLRIC